MKSITLNIRINNFHKWIATIGVIAIAIMQLLWICYSYQNTYKSIQDDIEESFQIALITDAQRQLEIISSKHPNDTIEIVDKEEPSMIAQAAPLYDVLINKYNQEIDIKCLSEITRALLSQYNVMSDFHIIHYKTQDEKPNYSSFYKLRTKVYPILLDHTQGFQLEIKNPYHVYFSRLGLLFLASLLMSIIIIYCLVKQIQIIKTQQLTARKQKDFSYAMIHDQKSPLTSLMLDIGNLKSGKLDDKLEKRNKLLGVMEKEAGHLLKLINMVLTISKIEGGKLTLNKQHVAIRPMLEDLAEKALARAGKEVGFTYDLRAETVYADKEYVKEAISNLIDNSIKYSNECVEIDFKSWEDLTSTFIEVRDNGFGIDKEDQVRIFQKFERSNILTSKGQGISGFGLGLNYVKQIISEHEGEVLLDSAIGVYSAFTLKIPNENILGYGKRGSH